MSNFAEIAEPQFATCAGRERLGVLYIVASGEMGGRQRFIDAVIGHHSERVHPVVLTFKQGAWLERLHDRGVAAYNLESPRLRQPIKTTREIMQIIRRERIRLVHSADAWCHSLAFPAALRCGCKRMWF